MDEPGSFHSHPALAGWQQALLILISRFNGFCEGNETVKTVGQIPLSIGHPAYAGCE